MNCVAIIYKVKNHFVRGYVLYPKEHKLSRLPAIVFNRGGSDLYRHTLKLEVYFYCRTSLRRQEMLLLLVNMVALKFGLKIESFPLE